MVNAQRRAGVSTRTWFFPSEPERCRPAELSLTERREPHFLLPHVFPWWACFCSCRLSQHPAHWPFRLLGLQSWPEATRSLQVSTRSPWLPSSEPSVRAGDISRRPGSVLTFRHQLRRGRRRRAEMGLAAARRRVWEEAPWAGWGTRVCWALSLALLEASPCPLPRAPGGSFSRGPTHPGAGHSCLWPRGCRGEGLARSAREHGACSGCRLPLCSFRRDY